MTVTTSRRLWPAAVLCAALSSLAGVGGLACSDGGGDLDPPDGRRETLAFVEAALAGDHGDPDGEATLVYAEVGAGLLADIAGDAPTGGEADLVDDRLAMGSAPAARFLALGMGTAEGRDRIRNAHRATTLDLAVDGLTAEQAGEASDWEEQVGKLDGIVVAAEVLGNDLSTRDANAVVAQARDAEGRVVAAAHLVVALRADADTDTGGAANAALAPVVDAAESAMAPDALGEVRAAVTGEFAEALDPALPDGIHDDLVDDVDLLREAFAGHDEYPVEAALSAVADAHDQHFAVAFSGPAPSP
jgi:hypothetical protein